MLLLVAGVGAGVVLAVGVVAETVAGVEDEEKCRREW